MRSERERGATRGDRTQTTEPLSGAIKSLGSRDRRNTQGVLSEPTPEVGSGASSGPIVQEGAGLCERTHCALTCLHRAIRIGQSGKMRPAAVLVALAVRALPSEPWRRGHIESAHSNSVWAFLTTVTCEPADCAAAFIRSEPLAISLVSCPVCTVLHPASLLYTQRTGGSPETTSDDCLDSGRYVGQHMQGSCSQCLPNRRSPHRWRYNRQSSPPRPSARTGLR